MRPNQTRIRLLTSAAFVVALALQAGGCQTMNATETTGSISPPQRSESEWRQEAESWKERYTKNPADAEAAYRYAAGFARDRTARANRRSALTGGHP